MKLFTVGPVEMYPETLSISGLQVPYFRTDDFSDMMIESEGLIKKILYTGCSSKVVFLTASGTGAMESAVVNFFNEDDKLLIVSGGGFGERFEQICSLHGISYDSVKIQFGEILTEQSLRPYLNNDYSGMLVNIDETSTGQLYDIHLLSDFCKKKGMYLVVDAISSFLADTMRMDEFGVDAVILSSQKALALSPGLSMVVMNSRIYEERVLKIPSKIFYLDFKRHIENQKRGQTPFTPCVGILLELNSMLHMIDEMGVENKIKATKDLCTYFRSLATEAGLCIPSYPLSNAVTPILFKDGSAKKVYDDLKSKYGFIVTPSGGDLKDIMLRVGHMGNIGKEDYDNLVDALKEVIE